MPSDIPDAIARARRDVAHVAECTVAVGLGFTGVCETEERLGPAGEAGVALAEKLWGVWLVAHADNVSHRQPPLDCDESPCKGYRKALQDWADAQDGEERNHD